MKIHSIFKLIALAILMVSGNRIAGGNAVEKPNVIFILADDLGWRDLSCYGSTFHETPNLDRLASRGMRFTQAYAACPVCSPTRASIMTGKYPARLHLTDYIAGARRGKLIPPTYLHQLPLEEVTVAEAFKDAGYRTAFVGKWHLGKSEFYPEHQGFDQNVGGCEKGSPPSYFSPYRIPTLTDGPPGEYLTDRLTDEALRLIKEAGDEPFFLYLSHYAVHNPQQAKPELVEKYRRKVQKQAEEHKGEPGPEFVPEGERQARQIQNQPTYAAMLESLDESVGRIMRQLEATGKDNRTIVVFTSDNGGLSTSEGSPTSNVPLRAGKGWAYEGGIREPLIVKWPGSAQVGKLCEDPVISTDFYPTLLEMAGLPARAGQHIDGVSFVPLLKGGTRPERTFYWHYPHYGNQGGQPASFLREGNLKLVEWLEDGRVELFDLRADPSERENIAARERVKAAALLARLHAWRKSVDASMPTPNPDYRPGQPNEGRNNPRRTKQAR